METKKDPESAQPDVFLELPTNQSRNLYDQSLGKTSEVCGFSGTCSGSLLVAEENGAGNRMLSPLQHKFSLQGHGNEDESFVDDPGMKEILAVERNEEIRDDKSLEKEDREKTNDALAWKADNFSRNVGVSGDGISLIVEVFGPPSGTHPGEGNNPDKQVLGEEDSDGEDTSGSSGTMSPSDGDEDIDNVLKRNDPVVEEKTNSFKSDKAKAQNKVEGDKFCNTVSTFALGDLVWAKTKKTQIWWPGVISDPVSRLPTSKEPASSNRKAFFFVKYFGSANSVWHSASHIRHLVEDFDRLCCQSNSRSFRGAIERAVYEISQRAKLEMTCSCYLREIETSSSQLGSQKWPKRSWSVNKMAASSASFESQFHPASFLALLKYLAQSASPPDKFQITTTKSCLWAIYRSLGHPQLSIQYLVSNAAQNSAHSNSKRAEKDDVMTEFSRANCYEAIDGEKHVSTTEAEHELYTPLPVIGEHDGRVDGRSKKCHGSRERKKSQYLSYPFLDPRKGHEKVLEQAESVLDVNGNYGQNTGKKSKNSVSSKASSSDMWDKAKDVVASSTEILSELHLAALGCSFTRSEKCSDSVSNFLSCLRRFAFLKYEEADEHIGDLMGETSVSSSCDTERSPGGDAVKRAPKRRQKEKRDSTSRGAMHSRKRKETRNGSEVTGSPEVDSGSPMKEKVSRKRKKARIDLGLIEKRSATGLPDLNGYIPAFSVEDDLVAESVTSYRLRGIAPESSCTQTLNLLDPGRGNMKFVQLLKDVQSMGSNFFSNMAQQNCMNNKAAFATSEVDRHSEAKKCYTQSALINKMQPICLGTKCEPKTRRKMKAAKPVDATVHTSIPDLNGNAVDCISPGNKAPDANSALPKTNVARKRRRKKSTDVILNVETYHNKSSITEGVSATSLAPLVRPILPEDGPKTPVVLPPDPARGMFTSAASNVNTSHNKQSIAAGVLATSMTPLAQPFLATNGLEIPAVLPPGPTTHNGGDLPDILFMKTNLEMMTSVLGKAGNNLSPQLKIKLEGEIRGLMEKISSMDSSSSS
ncbi:OLC1v1013181C4 [Oldenlandia corymbosa var. corymbosa]|uniref:OLC1v1013181C4 n=1 Tax=Oldenlandia corymbosa var. corymbosa TaxID=529605 RepID=A0AAV1DXN0_OLDCO|nr:OLC1v1013181C4 [Oldenlandia corymbosa var. corymbosa]